MIGLFRGVRFVLNSLSEVVEAELDDGERVKEELLELQMRLEVGEITDEEFAEAERGIMERLRRIRQRETGLPGAGDRIAGAEVVVDFDDPEGEA